MKYHRSENYCIAATMRNTIFFRKIKLVSWFGCVSSQKCSNQEFRSTTTKRKRFTAMACNFHDSYEIKEM